ncbi:hypothetical protein BC628DRAFT_1528064 [Trametes gibbosa]|nr:hypothetical protein BC628DRAFT_1528064 [Trametes gibbosa]
MTLSRYNPFAPKDPYAVPPGSEYTPTRLNTDGPKDDTIVDVRYLSRTPSPTPSEVDALSPENKKRRRLGLLAFFHPQTYRNPKELIRLLITGGIIALVVLFIVYQQNIVQWLRPFADWMKRTPAGWLIPIAIMIVMSFPPLFGHEIIAILCGDVWGVWIGFGIVAAGTILGELANYFVFKWFCMSRGKKMEEKKLAYALLAEVVRRGGLLMAIVIRFSAIPGHFSTAVFATCGMGIFTFLAAAFLSLPTQLATVYLGSAQSTNNVDSKAKIIKTVVIGVTVLVTVFAMHYVRRQTENAAPVVIYRRRKASRQAKLCAAAGMEPDPEAYGESVAAPLLTGRVVETVELDGVTLQVPQPQRGYAPPPPSSFASPSGGTDARRTSEGPRMPQPGYDQRARTPPTASPYER